MDDRPKKTPDPLHVVTKRRPPFQFSLLGLMVVTFVFAAAAAPGYYMLHSPAGLPQGRLVGTLMLLAGPLLLMTLISILIGILGRHDAK